MSTRVVLSCNGKWNGVDCWNAIPVGQVDTAAEARAIAKKFDWTHRLIAYAPSTTYRVEDLCPRCTRGTTY